MAHYFFYVKITFFFSFCLFAKITKMDRELDTATEKREKIVILIGSWRSQPLVIPNPEYPYAYSVAAILIWTCTRYNYLPTFNLLVQNVLEILNPIAYFLTLLMPGRYFLSILHLYAA